MKYNLPCEVVQDLMPTYVDGLTSEVTGECMEEHMKECQRCRKLFLMMKEPESISIREEEKKELDFLKRNRKIGRQTTIIAVMLAVIIVLGTIGIRLYVFGDTAISKTLEANVTVSEENQMVYLSAGLNDNHRGISKLKWSEQDGIVNIDVESTLRSPFHKNQVDESYQAKSKVREITLNGDTILWSEGMVIAPEISDIYQARNPYVGDIVKDHELACLLGLHSLIGTYKNELQTSTQPYGWKIIADNTFSRKEAEELNSGLKSIAMILLAMIDNLEYVEFEYQADDEACHLRVATEDADRFLMSSVKEFVQSPADLQKLIGKVDLYNHIVLAGQRKM